MELNIQPTSPQTLASNTPHLISIITNPTSTKPSSVNSQLSSAPYSSLNFKEFGIATLHLFFLVPRTVLSVGVAKLDGIPGGLLGIWLVSRILLALTPSLTITHSNPSIILPDGS
ncbi:hypothetical protein JAAARDRAFT_601985 [Jaapia argillacea MUCL 33604]|uniref:Uncharacterized protein n=1 Tax=Jaapia argillacea MUCL 33604 TaxID=933084 RepID=A0A067PZX8_9AGAM|nr:hypothetical protein JAAARDRAFT_601985 [Jaapia argillacea MUCL 33604]